VRALRRGIHIWAAAGRGIQKLKAMKIKAEARRNVAGCLDGKVPFCSISKTFRLRLLDFFVSALYFY